MPVKHQYLCKRPNSQYWQVRMTVPKQVRGKVGRTEFTASTGETEIQKAQTIAYSKLATWRAEIELAELGSSHRQISADQLRLFAAEQGYTEVVKNLDRITARAAGKGAISFSNLTERLHSLRTEKMRAILSRDFSSWETLITSRLDQHSLDIVKQENLISELAAIMARASVDAYNLGIQKLEGKGDATEPSIEIRSILSSKIGSEAKVDLAKLFEKYANQRLAEKRKRKDSVEQDRIVVSQFSEVVGEISDLNAISKADVKRWIEIAKSLPANWRKSGRYQGMSITEVAKIAKESDDKPKSLTTIKREISALSAFFRWCIINENLVSNPCNDLSPQVKKGRNRRPSYSDSDLELIFNSPLYQGCHSAAQPHVPGTELIKDWRFWIPLICLFTGARVGEISQLTIDDIQQHETGYILFIRHDPKRDQFTKNEQTRILPIHSTLVKLGLVAFWLDRKKACFGKICRLFEDVKPNKRGHIGDAATRFWCRYLEKIGVKDGADGFGVHSFRHTLTDRLRLAGYADNMAAVILGHSNNSVTSGYGAFRQGTIPLQREALESIEFKMLDFDTIPRRYL